jgi:hypothetical protein
MSDLKKEKRKMKRLIRAGFLNGIYGTGRKCGDLILIRLIKTLLYPACSPHELA